MVGNKEVKPVIQTVGNINDVELTVSQPAISDDELVALAIGGDKLAFQSLIERYEAKAFRLSMRILRNKADAEDVVQESFVKAFLSLSTFQSRSSFYTWLFRIVYHMSIDHQRRVGRRREQGDLENQETGSQSTFFVSDKTPYESLTAKEDKEKLNKALDTLSDEHRATIVLRELEGLSYEEISLITKVSSGTVMSRLHHARKKLIEELKRGHEKFLQMGIILVTYNNYF